jgi:RND family efflux transporter MFP subunit
MKTILKILFPLIVVGIGVALMFGLVMNREPVQPQDVVEFTPRVRVQVVQPSEVNLTVLSQGTVVPGTSISLVSEVAGTVVKASKAMAAGGYFEKGDVLLEIDPTDYELAVVQANARLLEAKARLLREQAEADVARIEWDELGKEGEASPLLLREPQLAEAEATVESAKANVKLAERDLEKTRIKAPFAGRILDTMVDIGQYVPRGNKLADIYSIETAEIRLPLSVQELAYVDVPFNFRGESTHQNYPKVKLIAKLGGRERTWMGRVIRTEGEIDPRTRMLTAVAEVENPYGRRPGEDVSPLAAGLFVQAEIQGETVRGIFELPRTAVNGMNQVLIVDERERLHIREVVILRAERDTVIVESGLEAGEQVCLTPLEAPVENMKVRVAERIGDGSDKLVQGGVL